MKELNFPIEDEMEPIKETDADGDIWCLYEYLESLYPRKARLYSTQIEVEIKNVSQYLADESPEVVHQVFPMDKCTHCGRKDEIGEITSGRILDSMRTETKKSFKVLIEHGASYKKELLKYRLAESLFASGLRKHFDML